MKTSLFQKRNILAKQTKNKQKQNNCLNCPANKKKSKCFLKQHISAQVEVLFILPSNSYSELRRTIKKWMDNQTEVGMVAFVPDIWCKHDLDIYRDDKKYPVRNLHCSDILHKTIPSTIKHVFIVGIGATRAYFGEEYGKDYAYNKVYGYTMPDVENNRLLSFIYEPSSNALMGDRKDKYVLERTIFHRTMQQAAKRIGSIIEKRWKYPIKYCKVLNEEEALVELDKILDGEYEQFIAYDYEATGLKPFREGQTLYTCSISPNPEYSFAFIMTDATNEKLKKILANIYIPIVAANNPYEYKMGKELLGFTVNNFLYDCCLGQHMLDLRRGVVSVKFQARMRYGVKDYEKPMKQYLVPSDEECDANGANAINTIMSAPIKSLLLYNALDSLLENWIARDSMDELGMEYDDE